MSESIKRVLEGLDGLFIGESLVKKEKKEKTKKVKDTKKKHYHKVQRMKVDWKNTEYLYKCRDNCNSYIYPNEIVGKRVVCWHCNEVFEVRSEDIQRAKSKPNCGCRRVKATNEIVNNTDWLED